MQTNIPNEVIEFLNQKGVLLRIEEDRQIEREGDRTRLMGYIAALSKSEAEVLLPALARQRNAQAALADAEAALQKARAALADAESQVRAADASNRIQQCTGQVARLADPRIHSTITQLINLEERARQRGFNTYTSREKSWDMVRMNVTEHNNGDEVALVTAEIRQATTYLQSLLYEQRPANLPEILEDMLSAGEAACRRLGVIVQRADRLANTTQH